LNFIGFLFFTLPYVELKPNPKHNSRSIFLRMGLRNGDIITGVNGKPLQSVDDAPKFIESVRSGENLSLQLI
jgi:general secretion pathway protein C